ncbi:MAG: DNA repair protein RecO [Phormidesmis sp.]
MKQRSYKAMGINLKAMPMGEADRLVTVLTKEYGLIRAIAPGARKHKSRLAGRSGLFVVNDLLFSKGKSIDKMVQAETLKSFPGLSKNLAKLTASQYLAEVALAQALSDQPQGDLYYLLIEHLSRLESAAKVDILPCLAQATFHLLALAGVAPDVFRCCLSRSHLTARLGDPTWRVGFSVSSGGAVDLDEVKKIERDRLSEIEHIDREWHEQKSGSLVSSKALEAQADGQTDRVKEASGQWRNQQSSTELQAKVAKEVTRNLGIVGYLSAAELALMQQLSQPTLMMTSPTAPQFASQSGTIRADGIAVNSAIEKAIEDYTEDSGPHLMWQRIEKMLRHYAQYQFDRPIKSAALIDTCFTPSTHAARV